MLLSGMYGFNVAAALPSALGRRARGLGSPRSPSCADLLPWVHNQAGDTQNVTCIHNPRLMVLPPGPGEASAQGLIPIWLKKKARPRECQRLWGEAESQLGYSLVLLSLLPVPPAGLGGTEEKGRRDKTADAAFQFGAY